MSKMLRGLCFDLYGSNSFSALINVVVNSFCDVTMRVITVDAL
jgi:hypothetical protein